MNWDPTTEEEIAQNVRSLVLTAQGAQLMARALGVSLTTLDGPVEVAQARIAAALQEQIRKHEPRARVDRIAVDGDLDGHLRPTVRLR